MNDQPAKFDIDRLYKLALIAIPVIALIPWAFFQLDTAVNTNHSWLTIAAGRMLDGANQIDAYYEPNPPLSLMVYIPPVLLSRLTGLPIYYAPYLFGMLYMALCAFSSHLLLKKMPDVSFEQRCAIIAALLGSCTAFATYWYFADRDELVLWGLFPFLLLQICLTAKIQVPKKLMVPVLVLGTIGILVKPHYGLFPVVMLLHRMIKQRRLFSIIKDPDFIALSIGVLAYAAIIVIFFRDYISTIFPEMMFYVSLYSGQVPLWSLMNVGVILMISMSITLYEIDARYSRIAQLFAAAAVLATFLYFIQMKGFYYHLIPLMAFAYCAYAVFIQGLLVKYFGSTRLVFLASLLLITGAPAYMTMKANNYVTHDGYRQTKLYKMVEDCAPDCSFFVFSENMEVIFQVSTYSGAEFASRYPIFIWLPAVLPELPFYKKDPEKAEELRARHHKYVVEDFQKYKPEYLAFIINKPLFSSGTPDVFDLADYLGRYPELQAVMDHYEKIDTIEDNRHDYFFTNIPEGEVEPYVFDIYKRKD